MLKKNKKLTLLPLAFLILFSVFAFSSGFVSAQEGGGSNVEGGGRTPNAELENPVGESSISKIIGTIIKVILGIIGVVSLIMFIYAGVVWLTAQGKADAIKRGRDTMLWAVVGLFVVFGSYVLLKYVFDKLAL